MNSQVLLYGFAVFSMFFGSGNLVFPLQIGLASGSDWMLGYIGLLFSGIILPVLGLFIIKLYHGNYENFFSNAGVIAQKILPLFTLSLLGSFGVVPRCITVAYGGVSYLLPELSLTSFSIIFCIICFFSCLKENIMFNLLGKYLTPLLLLCLSILIIYGILNTEVPYPSSSSSDPKSGFLSGFLQGYETMDLFASFFFSSLIFNRIREANLHMKNEAYVMKVAVKASIFGGALLSVVYLGFVFLGSKYEPLIRTAEPESYLPIIASSVLGKYASLSISIITLFSCLTTAMALNGIYTKYLCSLCKLKPKYFVRVLGFTTGISFIISLLDFQGIASFLVPILEASYPSLIALTFISLLIRKKNLIKPIVFYSVLIITLINKYFF